MVANLAYGLPNPLSENDILPFRVFVVSALLLTQ